MILMILNFLGMPGSTRNRVIILMLGNATNIFINEKTIEHEIIVKDMNALDLNKYEIIKVGNKINEGQLLTVQERK